MDNEAEVPSGSPSSVSWNSKLQLPLSCDPPGPQNPAKQRVWVVSYTITVPVQSLRSLTSTDKPIFRSSAPPATLVAPSSKPPLPIPIASRQSVVA